MGAAGSKVRRGREGERRRLGPAGHAPSAWSGHYLIAAPAHWLASPGAGPMRWGALTLSVPPFSQALGTWADGGGCFAQFWGLEGPGDRPSYWVQSRRARWIETTPLHAHPKMCVTLAHLPLTLPRPPWFVCSVAGRVNE